MIRLDNYRSRWYQAWVLIGVLFPLQLSGQFDGGANEGTAIGLTLQLTLDGVPAGIRPLYAGGKSDGYSQQAATYTTLGSTATLQLYAGGRGDGYTQFSASLSLSGQNLIPLFGGGSGDGYSSLAQAMSLNGQSMATIYGGGQGDGYSGRAIAVSLNGFSQANLYGGGPGDGYAGLAYHSVLGDGMAMLYRGGNGDGFALTATALSLNGTSLRALYSGGSGDGYGLDRYAGIVPLPLTLVRFEAFPEDTYVVVQWVTEDEIDTDFFTIERTPDGQVFSTVGTELAAGYSLPGEQLHYQLIDETPLAGTSYYRLKTTDIDEAISYSQLVKVQFAQPNSPWDFRLYPNPSTGRHFNVATNGLETDEELTLEILDVTGRSLERRPLQATNDHGTLIQLAQPLNRGSYVIRLVHPSKGQQAKILIVGGL